MNRKVSKSCELLLQWIYELGDREARAILEYMNKERLKNKEYIMNI
jgi:DNA primase catalytic subunit